ncbi:hypothetical protein MWH93_004395 [Salmonella enterica]|uniref:Transmembrane protein n=3 Tax=Salmonella enterica TaxID=28901 RepID=A0A626IP77_SALET|nr:MULTISPECIES: hypothetical protein [Enterobacteriaceae]EAB9678588.1 hypothetical protein [Salmonella enterica subsp. enterica serovar Agona]EAO3044480.1 hypothetical protein [Salmonella enterica subsp. enterica serovar Johannesburg]EAS6313496.1 hypothetical protein [Salmonella enterica]EBG0324163.1 hypothetical protein [Salmonella enterica subsp. enterica serovar Infantis]EBW1918400.1 hypothetical protein [Salmonella enterica subsp. enterica serovar Newport]EBY7590454.1 hypothetical protei
MNKTKLIAYAVFFLVSYMAIYSYVYQQNVDYLSPPAWRVFTAIAVAVAVLASLAPAFAFKGSTALREDGEINICYFCPMFTLMLIALCFIGKSLYFWSFELDHIAIKFAATVYLTASPIFSLMFYYVQIDKDFV